MNQRDIARLVGVSAATVSRVINGKTNVAQSTVEKVLKAIQEHGYVSNTLAKSLRTQRTNTIGCVVPDINNPFFPEVLEGIEKVCVHAGYKIILGNTNEDPKQERDVVETLWKYRVDGLLMVLVDSTGGTLKEALRGDGKELPIVFIDRSIDGFEYDSVTIDNVGGTKEATNYLLDLGHTRIAIVHGPLHTSPGRERLQGFLEAMQSRNIEVPEAYIREGDFRKTSGYRCAEYLVSLPQRPTAIIGGNNLMTMGIFEALSDFGIAIPREISLVGFDDFALAGYLNPPLTVVERPVSEMGTIGAQLLISRIEQSNNLPYQKVVLQTKLKIRKSCLDIAP